MNMHATSQPKPQKGLPGYVLVLLYLALALGPIAAALIMGGSNALSFWPKLARIAGIAALAMMLIQFVTSGRFETVSGRIGLDRTMSFHRVAATALLVMIGVHVGAFVLRSPNWNIDRLAGRLWTYINAPYLQTGVISAGVLALIVVTAKYLRRNPIPYPAWRLFHGIAAVLATIFAAHHTYANARFLADPYGLTAIGLLGAMAAASIFYVYVLRPRQAFRQGFVVESTTQKSPHICELTLTTNQNHGFSFLAGQFCWLTLNGRHTVTDNPFSIASSPSDLPRLRFLIRNAGDMSAEVANLKPGTPIGVDGPHGSFTLAPAGDGPLLLVAGGIGIAPILSILRDLAARGDKRPVRLLSAARTPQDHVCRDDILALGLGLNFKAIFVVDHFNQEQGFEQGQCEKRFIERLIQDLPEDRPLAPNKTTAFVCGPPAMMDSAITFLLETGVPEHAIIMERFDYDGAKDVVSKHIRWRFAGILLSLFAGIGALAVWASS